MSVLRTIVLVCVAFAGLGCTCPMLNVDDVIACPGEEVRLHAYLETRSFLLTTGRLPGHRIRFQCDDGSIPTAVTDRNGEASITCDAGTRTWAFTATARIGDWRGRSTGNVFVWDPARPALAIDMDETLIRSHYLSLIFDALDQSPPMPQSQEVLSRLAHRFNIIYISARARLFREKSQHWLREHGYPPGPIVHGKDFGAVIEQHQAKRNMLRELRKKHPTLTVGIGDKGADEHAFLANDMTCIIISPFYPFQRKGTIVLRDWREAEALLLDGERLGDTRLANDAYVQQGSRQGGPP